MRRRRRRGHGRGSVGGATSFLQSHWEAGRLMYSIKAGWSYVRKRFWYWQTNLLTGHTHIAFYVCNDKDLMKFPGEGSNHGLLDATDSHTNINLSPKQTHRNYFYAYVQCSSNYVNIHPFLAGVPHGNMHAPSCPGLIFSASISTHWWADDIRNLDPVIAIQFY